MVIIENKDFKQLSVFDQLLPESYLKLQGELAIVDELLKDESLFAPFIEKFNSKCGRHSTPVDTYIRMMYLKFRYNLGYETLCKEVGDSITWRIFCHIPICGEVPDYTTLAKLTKRFGKDTLEELNSLIVQKAIEKKLIKARKIRIDTTVIKSNIHYPTDAGLLSDGVRVLTRLVKKVKDTGIAAKAEFRDRTRSIKKRILNIVKFTKNRTNEAKEKVHQTVKELVEIAKDVLCSAKKVSEIAKEEIKNTQNTNRSRDFLIQKLENTISIVDKVISQTSEVLKGTISISNRVVSIFDQGARPIKRGKAKADIEFGRKVALAESEEGLIICSIVEEGNPADKTLAVPTVKKAIKVLNKVPKEVTGDRGFYSSTNEKEIRELKVEHVAIPKPGKKSEKRIKFERQH
ncbi:ISNCY family transposase [Thermoanaerobacter wiegelii]|uniref:ISNCY family transposase n=1 Tax=Thermoanaerobacter wiegelii TaxID=46354 RepID=UPI0001E50030|nr:ISNCY family transposase [Thermoanaerobacter wiegelii]